MSIFSKIGKLVGKVTKAAQKAAPILTGIGTGGTAGVLTALGGAAALARKKGAKALPALQRVAPGAGKVAAGAVVGAGAQTLVLGADGQTYAVPRRRRRKGITAKDLQSFKRVARLVDKYAKPVHHFRNIKK